MVVWLHAFVSHVVPVCSAPWPFVWSIDLMIDLPLVPPIKACSDGMAHGHSLCIAGEWEGVTATFSSEGKPQQLPDRYVPDAFRDWNVELYDWQSQCR